MTTLAEIQAQQNAAKLAATQYEHPRFETAQALLDNATVAALPAALQAIIDDLPKSEARTQLSHVVTVLGNVRAGNARVVAALAADIATLTAPPAETP